MKAVFDGVVKEKDVSIPDMVFVEEIEDDPKQNIRGFCFIRNRCIDFHGTESFLDLIPSICASFISDESVVLKTQMPFNKKS